MPILKLRDRLVLFIHVPKTGGSSVEAHLAASGPLLLKNNRRLDGFPCSLQHLHGAALEALFPADAFDWSFMLVRHPAARLVSQYRYQTRKPNWARDRMPFPVWLRYALARRGFDPYYRDNHFRPQVDFEGFSAEVMRLEDGLDRCFSRIAERLGIAPPAAAIWEKRSASQPVSFGRSELDLMRRTYAEDFERYGYGTGEADLAAAGLHGALR